MSDPSQQVPGTSVPRTERSFQDRSGQLSQMKQQPSVHMWRGTHNGIVKSTPFHSTRRCVRLEVFSSGISLTLEWRICSFTPLLYVSFSSKRLKPCEKDKNVVSKSGADRTGAAAFSPLLSFVELTVFFLVGSAHRFQLLIVRIHSVFYTMAREGFLRQDCNVGF